METKQYPLFMQTWFPSVGVMNKIGQIQDKKLLQWAYNQFLSWNQLVLPKESFHFQKAQEGNHCLLGWITIVQGKEDFGRSYKEIRAVLFDEKASLEDQQTLKEKLFSYPIQTDTPSQELMLEWSCLPQEPVIEIKQEDTLAEPVEKQEHTNVETMPVEEKKKTCHGLDKRSYAAIFFCMVFLFSVWGLTWKFISQNKTSVLNEKGKKINPYKNNNQFSTQFNNKEKRNSPLLKHRDPYFLNYFLKHIENWEKSLTKISVSPEKNLSKEKKEEPISLSKKYTIFFVYPEGALDILKWQEEDILSKKEKKIYLCKGKYILKAIRSKNCYWKKAQIIKPEGKKTEKIWEQEKTEQATQKSEITIASDTTIVFELEHRINSISVQPEGWGEIEYQGEKKEEFPNICFDYGEERKLNAIPKDDRYEFEKWEGIEEAKSTAVIKKSIPKIIAHFKETDDYSKWKKEHEEWLKKTEKEEREKMSQSQLEEQIASGEKIQKKAKNSYNFDRKKLKELEDKHKLNNELLIKKDLTTIPDPLALTYENLKRFKKYENIINKNFEISITIYIKDILDGDLKSQFKKLKEKIESENRSLEEKNKKIQSMKSDDEISKLSDEIGKKNKELRDIPIKFLKDEIRYIFSCKIQDLEWDKDYSLKEKNIPFSIEKINFKKNKIFFSNLGDATINKCEFTIVSPENIQEYERQILENYHTSERN